MVELTRRIAPDLVHVMMVALLGPARQSIGTDTGPQPHLMAPDAVKADTC
jgi:hypothetical protein